MSMTGVEVRRVKLPYPHPGQQHVLRNAKRFNWLSAGRRWRKTTLGISIIVEACLRGETWLWGAPTYKQMMIAWDELVTAVGDVAAFKKGDQDIHFPTGGRIYMRSLDNPDSARGYTADGAVLDEVADIKEDAYYEIVRPMLIDTGGPLWAIGTPKGRNWFWREFHRAKDYPDATAWQIPTVGCEIVEGSLVRKPHPLENPDIEFVEIKNAFERSPQEIFEQEYLAQFKKFGGSVFRNIQPNLYLPNGKDLVAEHEGHMKIMTMDWAKHIDFTTIHVGCGDCRIELEMDRFNTIDYTYQRDRVKTLYEKWKPEVVLAEKNSIGEPNIELLWEDGVPVTGWDMTAYSKPGLVRGLGAALERETWKWIADKNATFELEAYEQKTNRNTGRSTYSAPKGVHDDTVIARALMVYAEANMGHIPIMVT